MDNKNFIKNILNQMERINVCFSTLEFNNISDKDKKTLLKNMNISLTKAEDIKRTLRTKILELKNDISNSKE